MPVEQVTQPAYLWIPSHATSSAGREAVDLARSIGMEPDAEEELALDALLAERSSGKWASLEAAVICGRQNLKTWTLQMSVLYDLYLRDVGLVVWTAHRFRTTQEAFRDIHALVDSYDHLRRRVRKVRTANGEEGIELLSGARLDFLARTSGGGRGLSGDTVILDEALYLTPTMMGSLLPTLSARPDPHVRYGSSAGLRESEVLRGIRERGRAGGDPSLVYVEWSSEPGKCAEPTCTHAVGSAGCQLDDVESWRAANPALGRRISVEYLAAERRALEPTEFARERLGWWEDPRESIEGENFPIEAWDKRLDAASKAAVDSPIAFAIDTSWDRKTTWISAAGDRTDGRLHTELLIGGPGTDWVIPWFLERRSKYRISAIGLQGSGAPVSSLLEPLREALGVDLVKALGVQEIGRACGAFYDAISSGLIAHIGQEQLEDGVRLAAVRPIGDAWVVDRKASTVDVAPLVSAIEAAYLAKTVTYEPPRKRSAPRRIR